MTFWATRLTLAFPFVEFARNVLKMEDANSTEVEPDCKHKVGSTTTTSSSSVAHGPARTCRTGRPYLSFLTHPTPLHPGCD